MLVLLRYFRLCFNVYLARHRECGGYHGYTQSKSCDNFFFFFLQSIALSPWLKVESETTIFIKVKDNVATMAFFGLTNMGHQNPIGDKMIGNYRRASLPQGKMSWTPVKLTLALR